MFLQTNMGDVWENFCQGRQSPILKPNDYSFENWVYLRFFDKKHFSLKIDSMSAKFPKFINFYTWNRMYSETKSRDVSWRPWRPFPYIYADRTPYIKVIKLQFCLCGIFIHMSTEKNIWDFVWISKTRNLDPNHVNKALSLEDWLILERREWLLTRIQIVRLR